MKDFGYVNPKDLREAVAALQLPGSVPLAGGQALLQAMRMQRIEPSVVVDLSKLDELREINFDDDTLVIGALVTHTQLANDARIRRAVPALADTAARVADPAVRHRGTVGGSIAENHPGGDYPAVFVALSATVHTNFREILSLTKFGN